MNQGIIKTIKLATNCKRNSFLLTLLLSMSNMPLHAAQRPETPAGYTHNQLDDVVTLGVQTYDERTLLHRMRHLTQVWRDPNGRRPNFPVTIDSLDGPLEGIGLDPIIYAQPFASQGVPISRDQRANFRGRYNVRSPLNGPDKIPVGPLFYCSGTNIYVPRVIQQRWIRVDGADADTEVDFLIVACNEVGHRKLKFIPEARNSIGQPINSHLPAAGLYQLIHVVNQPVVPGRQTYRIESWKKLESDGTAEESLIEIRTSYGVLSIPGISLFALNQRLNNQVVTDPDLARLIETIHETRRHTRQNMTAQNAQQPTLLVMGPSKSGKTSLLNILGGKPCEGRIKIGSRRRDDFETFLRETFEGFDVGYQNESQTKVPRPLPVLVNGMRIWDSPGIYDTEGGWRNVANVMGIRELFAMNSGMKILLTIKDSELDSQSNQIFLDLLGKTLDLFPHDGQLHNIFHLLVTQTVVGTDLENYLMTFDSDSRVTGNPRLQSLINLLRQEPGRISYFYKPTAVGPYDPVPNLRDILESIEVTGFFTANLSITPSIQANSGDVIVSFARSLNADIVHHLQTRGAQGVIDYCKNLIFKHSGTTADLRLNLTNLTRRLRGLASKSTPIDFINELNGTEGPRAIKRIYDTRELSQLAADLTFLKSIHSNGVSYEIAAWANAFTNTVPYLNTIGKIETLTTIPTPIFQGGVLTLQGSIVGLSDVNLARQDSRIVTGPVTQLHLNASVALMLDEDITLSGGQCHFISPLWNLCNLTLPLRIIDLSGPAADPLGQPTAAISVDGVPGNPGKNGGNLYGKGQRFANLFRTAPNAAGDIVATSNLSVITNGGPGGQGQNGGDGRAGNNGTDAGGSVVYAESYVGQSVANMWTMKTLGDSIRRIDVVSGADLDFIKIYAVSPSGAEYVVGNIGNAAGGGGNPQIVFGENEKLIEISGYWNGNIPIINQIKFVTSSGNIYGPYGHQKGSHFCFRKGYDEIIGIKAISQGTSVGQRISSDFGVFFQRKSMSQPETAGHNGGNGGRGGIGGVGGNPGVAIINGVNWEQDNQDKVQGDSGAAGTPGGGGVGGAHGRPYLGYLGYQPSALAATSSGVSPAITDLNASGQQQPSAQPSADSTNAERAERRRVYRAFYKQQAANPLLSPFVGSLPGLD